MCVQILRVAPVPHFCPQAVSFFYLYAPAYANIKITAFLFRYNIILSRKFILKQEKLEADRKIIEAKGTREAQKILAEGLTPEIIKLKSIEAFRELSKSANSKIIVTDGEAPLLIN